MMLLLALHASISYMVTPLGTIWPFKDNSTGVFLDIGAIFLHAFRLPLFFVMAGFFGAKLYEQRGLREFVKNRLKRIAIPLVLFWVVLTPLILAPFALFLLEPGPRTIPSLLTWLVGADARSHLHFFHLWFLFDLLVYYAALLILVQIGKLSGLTKWSWSQRCLGLLFADLWGPVLCALPTAVTLLPTPQGILETPGSFARPIATLLANGVFFMFGWGLFIRRDLMDRFATLAWRRMIIGIVLFCGHLICIVSLLGTRHVPHILSVAFASLATWFLVYGITGLFVRYGSKPSRVGRYIADSSYWCYLVHMPLIAWISLAIAGWNIHAIAKFAVVFLATALISLMTYDCLVRSTAIGALINGRRLPRWQRYGQTQ